MHKGILLFVALTTSALTGAKYCAPAPPAPCNVEECKPCYCLGPSEIIANAPVYPWTCDGDIVIEASALYWKANQDGMEYAIQSDMSFQTSGQVTDLNGLYNFDYKTPKFQYAPGFKLGVSYYSPCDGWDIGIRWISFNGKASSEDQAVEEALIGDPIDHVLIALWVNFKNPRQLQVGLPFFVNKINTKWKSNLDVIDLVLGREFWASKLFTLHPYVGIRGLQIKQKFCLEHKGGILSDLIFNPIQLNNEITLDNDFKGIGLVSGFDCNWHFGCGWSLYNELGASIVYGEFDIKHDEQNREAVSPFSKTKILETKNCFRASRGILDFALGLEYSALVCDCKYGIMTKLGWEQHLFFDQNQMWRVVRKENPPSQLIPNSATVFSQRRGTLSTQGLTLTFKFLF